MIEIATWRPCIASPKKKPSRKTNARTRRSPTRQIFVLEMHPRNLITVFRKFPKQLFRANHGLEVKLRVWEPQMYSYEIFAPKGMVEPKALNKATYISEQPNSKERTSFVRVAWTKLIASPEWCYYAAQFAVPTICGVLADEG